MMTLEDEEHFTTYKVMLGGLVAALIMTAPYVNWLYTKDWVWAERFPISWLGIMMNMMMVFFHELGHTIAFWFYGVVAVPSFDLTYGGGMTYAVTSQLWILNLAVYGGLMYLFRVCKGYRGWQIFWVLLGLFHVATAYSGVYETIGTCAGPLGEVAMAGFLLTRAWCDWAPRGLLERFLNAAFGWGLSLHALTQGWSLIHDEFVRDAFFHAKGGEGFGDFNRIADALNLGFNQVIWSWLICIVLGMVVPVLIYIRHRSVLSAEME